MDENSKLVVGMSLDLATQLVKLQTALHTAAAQGRSLTKEEVAAARESAQSAIDRLNVTLALMT